MPSHYKDSLSVVLIALAQIFLYLIFVSASTSALAGESFIDPAGYKYFFKESIAADGSKLVAIETFAPGSSELLARIPDIPPDSCTESKLQGIEKLPTNTKATYIAICRNDLGRSQTLYIMASGRLISEIFFESSLPNLKWDKQLGSFVAKAYPRYLDDEGTLEPFLVLYVWNPLVPLDKNAHVTFNEAASRYYLAYYQTLKSDIRKNAKNGKHLLASLVAALVSTSSSKLICKELNTPPLSTLQQDQLKDYFIFIGKYGFPTFDLTYCTRGE